MGDADRDTSDGEPERFPVCPTTDRGFAREYIVQLNRGMLHDRFPGTAEDDFLLIRNPDPIEAEAHARVRINDDIEDGTIGLDFTLRNALGAPSRLEVEHGEAESVARVEVEPMTNPEGRLRRRVLNRRLGVRPQVCRVRMGVFPDLEDKICRLPTNTMEMIGIEDGDNVTIESTRGDRIVRGVKAYAIDEERRETKDTQKERDEERYPPCEEMLRLDRIRRTEVDIPELWIDQEVRSRLGLSDLAKSGVCQPVRVYRDTWYLLRQTFHEFTIPLVVVLIAAGFDVQGTWFGFQAWNLRVVLWVSAVLLWTGALLIESRSRLS